MNDLLAIMTIDELYPWDPPTWRSACSARTIPNTRWSTRWRRWGRLNASGPDPGAADAAPLRLSGAAPHAGRGPRGAGADRAPERRRVPDAQPAAPRARGADQAGRRPRSTACCCCIRSVGMTKPGDVDHYTRVRTYKALARELLRPGPDRPVAAAAGDAHGRARARRSGTRSSGATTARTTSSSAATTPARGRTRPASRSTARTTPRSWSSSSRTRSASR